MRDTFYGFKLSEITDITMLITIFGDLNNQTVGQLFGISSDIARRLRDKLGVPPHQRNGYWGDYKKIQTRFYNEWAARLTEEGIGKRTTELRRTKWHMLLHPSVSLALRTPPAEVPSWQTTAAIAEFHVEEEHC